MKKDYRNILILLLISLVALWQVISLTNCLKWDFVDISLPWRFFIGESIQNGFLPLWTPYGKLGFPQYFDPQTWYPLSWLISLTSGYSVFTIQAEFVLHVFLAGVGMYFFMQHFSEDKKIRLFASVIFMLSGFFIGNAQHLGWIVSGTWIPFVFNSYLNIYKKKIILPVLIFTLFLFLLFTGGYFPFFVTAVYIVIIIFIYKTIIFIKRKDYITLKKTVLRHLLFGVIFIFISLVVVLSLVETKEFIGRGNGITIEKALNQSIEFEALLTFTFPFSTMWGDIDFWGADKTVINSYFGLIPFLILMYGIFIRKTKTELTFLLLGIFAYIIAMGNVFPVRKIFYYILPFFEYFRFPSLFRYFGILSFSIFSALILKRLLSEKISLKKFRIYNIIILIALLFLVIYSYKNTNQINIRIHNWFEYINNVTFRETIVIQGIIHLIVLSATCIILFLNKKNSQKTTLILIIIIFDMLMSAQLNAPKTVYSKANAKELQINLNKLPGGFPIPDISEKIININDKGKSITPLWRNMNFYYKKTAYTGLGPYQLNNFTDFERSGLFSDLLNNPILYFAEKFYPISGILDTAFIKNNSEGIVLTDNQKLLNCNFKNNNVNQIVISKYRPKSIEAKVSCSEKSFLVFMQNYKEDWCAYVDNQKVESFLVNYSLQGIIIPKGKHTVRFSFENRTITNSFYISSFSFITLLIFITYFLLKSSRIRSDEI